MHKFESIIPKTSENLLKTVYATLFFCKFTYFITHVQESKDSTKKVDKTLLTDGIFASLLCRFILNKKLYNAYLNKFFKMYIKNSYCTTFK